jgi:hypothetical protein
MKRELAAYLEETGLGQPPPEAPCPAWMDPEEDFRRFREGWCLQLRASGKLAEGQFLPGMSETERCCVDRYINALAVFAKAVKDTPASALPSFLTDT